jgi:hypothetical protein
MDQGLFEVHMNQSMHDSNGDATNGNDKTRFFMTEQEEQRNWGKARKAAQRNLRQVKSGMQSLLRETGELDGRRKLAGAAVLRSMAIGRRGGRRRRGGCRH